MAGGPQRPELLAPAGDWECLRAAVANGADAVYFGLSQFNARHRATNFTLDELPAVIAYLHQHNVKGYVAFNTLVFSDELVDAVRFLTAIAEAGADAVIMQDLGLIRLCRRLVPDLPIHASTQTTLTEPRGIDLVKSLGVERVILARELSIEQIERITQQTDMPVEVFVHGALCVAYSGQCLTSEALGGRSANRGQCAQACRLPYEMIVDGSPHDLGDRAYLLSPQDLAAFNLIDRLTAAGVCSFKIEGRLKSAQYVAITTRTYREALTAAVGKEAFTLARQDRLDLEQSFSRGFSPGFLEGPDHQMLVQGRFPKTRGVRVGTVVGKTPRGVIVELASPDLVKPGDGVVFDEGHPEQDEQGGRVFEVNPLASGGRKPPVQQPAVRHSHGGLTPPARRVELVLQRGSINLAAIARDTIVWKTDDPAFRKRMERTYAQDAPVRRVPVTAELFGRAGEALHLQMTAEGSAAAVSWPGPLQRAIKHPLGLEMIRDQLGRLGDTPFELSEVRMDLPEPVMVPKSILNELRRQAVSQLLAFRAARSHVAVAEPEALANLRAEIACKCAKGHGTQDEGQLYVLVRTMAQLEAVLAWQPPNSLPRPALVWCDFEDIRRYRDAVALAKSAGMSVGLATLRIVKPGEEGFLRQIAGFAPDALLVRNLAGMTLLAEEAADIPLVGDFSLNVANEITADLFTQKGLVRVVPGYDLNWDQLTGMLGRIDPARFEVVIHQHMPMFHMEHCVFAAFLSNGRDWRDCGRPCDRHAVALRDRVGAAFPVVADAGCRNTVFNAVPQSAAEYLVKMQDLGVRHFRVELLRESAAEVAPLLERYGRVLAGDEDGRQTWRRLQALNQLGVTRGTLRVSLAVVGER